MKSSLLILAAGVGSRYGGLKQLDPVGPGRAVSRSCRDAQRGWGGQPGAGSRIIANGELEVSGDRRSGQVGDVNHHAVEPGAVAGVVGEPAGLARQ